MIWPTVPLRRLARIVNGGTPAKEPGYWDGDIPWATPIDLGRAHGGVLTSTGRALTAEGAAVGSVVVPPGSVLVSNRAPIGYVARAIGSMAFNQGCRALVPLSMVDPRFLTLALVASRQAMEARGLGTTFTELSSEGIASVPIPLPSTAEHQRIADFLDARVKKILQMLAHKADKLRLLEEREQAMLDHVLVDTSPKVPLRRLTKIQTGVTVDGGRTGSHLVYRPYLRVANVKADRLDLADVKEIAVAAQDAATATLRPGDVLMTEGGDLDKLGRGTLWRGEIPACIHQNHVFAVRPDSRLSGEYLALMTRTSLARAYFESTGSRTTNLASTNTSKIASFPVPLPAFGAQVAMVKEAAVALEVSATLRAHVEQHRDLLRERQQALITAAVTGEIDVTTARRGDVTRVAS